MNLAAFLAKWSPTGGAERANEDSFLGAYGDVATLLGGRSSQMTALSR